MTRFRVLTLITLFPQSRFLTDSKCGHMCADHEKSLCLSAVFPRKDRIRLQYIGQTVSRCASMSSMSSVDASSVPSEISRASTHYTSVHRNIRASGGEVIELSEANAQLPSRGDERIISQTRLSCVPGTDSILFPLLDYLSCRLG